MALLFQSNFYRSQRTQITFGIIYLVYGGICHRNRLPAFWRYLSPCATFAVGLMFIILLYRVYVRYTHTHTLCMTMRKSRRQHPFRSSFIFHFHCLSSDSNWVIPCNTRIHNPNAINNTNKTLILFAARQIHFRTHPTFDRFECFFFIFFGCLDVQYS